jgi:hypothetical protein
MIDPFVGRYYSAAWVKKNVLRMSDEEIEEMEKEIEEEGPRDPVDAQGNAIQQEQPEASAEQFPPEDNTQETGGAESLTPELDAAVEKFSGNINKK